MDRSSVVMFIKMLAGWLVCVTIGVSIVQFFPVQNVLLAAFIGGISSIIGMSLGVFLHLWQLHRS